MKLVFRKDGWIILSMICISYWKFAAAEDADADADADADEEEEVVEPHFAVLYPWFVEGLGIIVFFITVRYFNLFPYTAIMFLLGLCMGIGVTRLNQNDDQLTDSIRIWENINSEVLLLVFLPGLVFSDAYGLNVHLFQVSLWQCLILAFPMVLAGNALTACVAYWVFPFNWSWNLAMTVGSILSATDPVAVNALLESVGAPPRLKMLITGESLLNDGSAMVFYTIFSGMYLAEISSELGEEVDVGEGFALFFRMSLGGAAVGIAFGLALITILYLLNRKLESEENVVQVTATITIAYLTYYVADSVCGTSGVIAVVMCGVLTKAFGSRLINNVTLMEDFWALVEQLLNTLLFGLGGTVFGTIIANSSDIRKFTGEDWGYLFVLFILLNVIRFFLVFAFYPIVARIGLKCCWQEAVFMSYGGLRGAVGISLAIALDSLVQSGTQDPVFLRQSTTMFGMIGGTAFLTLFINGTTAGWVLKALGLTSGSQARDKLLESYDQRIKENLLDKLVYALSLPGLEDLDFAVVKQHVPYLQDLTPFALKKAVLKYKRTTLPEDYRKPKLDKILPFLLKSTNTSSFGMEWTKELDTDLEVKKSTYTGHDDADLKSLQMKHGDKDEVKQLRLIYLDALRASYGRLVQVGFLDVRAGSPGYVYFSLIQGIDFAVDSVNKGSPLNDWESSLIVKQPWEDYGSVAVNRANAKFCGCFGKTVGQQRGLARLKLQHDVNCALAFIIAHHRAHSYFEHQLCGATIGEYEMLVQKEGENEKEKAIEFLHSLDKEVVSDIKDHNVCVTMLTAASDIIEDLLDNGMLKQQEANEKMEALQKLTRETRDCEIENHGEDMVAAAGDVGDEDDAGDTEGGPKLPPSIQNVGASIVEA